MIGRPGRCGRSDGGRIPVMHGGLVRGGLPVRPGLISQKGLAVARIPAGRRLLAGRLGRPARGIGITGARTRRLSALARRHIHSRPGRGLGTAGARTRRLSALARRHTHSRPARGLGTPGARTRRLNALARRHTHSRPGRSLGVVGVEAKRLSVLAGTRLYGRPPRGPGSIGPGATRTRRFRRPSTRSRTCCRPYGQQRRTSTPCAHGSSPPRRHIAMTRPDGQPGSIRLEFPRTDEASRILLTCWPPVDGTPQCLPGRPGPPLPSLMSANADGRS
jgi:hypothetical protein